MAIVKVRCSVSSCVVQIKSNTFVSICQNFWCSNVQRVSTSHTAGREREFDTKCELLQSFRVIVFLSFALLNFSSFKLIN